MKSFNVLSVLLAGGLFLGGCANTAKFEAKDGHYEAHGRSSNPEAMMATLSVNRAREINADAWATAVKDGRAYPNMMGPGGAYAQLYAPNGVLIAAPPAQPVMAAPAPQAAPPSAPSANPAAKPVTREEIEKAQKSADEARKRADVALHVLQKIRTEDGAEK